MPTQAVLIIGGSGFVGTHLAGGLRGKYKVFATYRTRRISIPGVSFIQMGVDSRLGIERAVRMARPAVIIYAAGSHSTEWAEANSVEAEAVHAAGVANVAGATDYIQPQLIYLSSCHVFDGARGKYAETDATLGSSILGKAKVSAENMVRLRSINHVILRSAPLFGLGNGMHPSFLDSIRMSLDRGRPVELKSSEKRSFAHVQGLVEVVEKAIARRIRNRVLHYGGRTPLSCAELGRSFARRFGYDETLIRSAESGPARDYSLSCSETESALKVQTLLLEQGFDLLDQELVACTVAS